MNLHDVPRLVVKAASKGLRPVLPATTFDRWLGFARLGYLPNLQRPETFSEKLLWLKRHYRHPDMPAWSDKLASRSKVQELLPHLAVPRTLGSWGDADSVPWDDLPDGAVLKSNHGSGHVLILGPEVDRRTAAARAAAWLADPYGRDKGEWVYQTVTPTLFAEENLSRGGMIPSDYKVFVLNGRASYVHYCTGRYVRLRRWIFDSGWRFVAVYGRDRVGVAPRLPDPRELPASPACLDELLRAAETIGAPFPFVRVDFYVVDERPVFGEATFFPASGYPQFTPVSFDRELGAQLRLPPPAPVP